MSKLTPEAEKAAWRALQERQDPSARAALIEHYAPYVTVTLNRQRLPPCVDWDDLVGDGYLALCKSVDRFDPARGTKFRNFLITHLKGAFLERLRSDDWVPRSERDKAKRGEPALIQTIISLEGLCEEWDSGAIARDFVSEKSMALHDPAPGPEELCVAKLTAEAFTARIQTTLKHLDSYSRRALTGRYLDELGPLQLAQREGVSGSAIHLRLMQARKRFRAVWGSP